MDNPKHAPDVRFVGDLDDPWVVAIAEVLASGSNRVHVAGDLPDSALGPCDLLVIHRPILSRHDADRLRRLRSAGNLLPRILLCHGSHVRYEELVRWSDLVDVVIHEATAVETLPRHVRSALGEAVPITARRGSASSTTVTIVSANFALRQTLRDLVELLGYRVTASRDFSDAIPTGTALWDVPWLEADWSREIARRSKSGALIALLGFADRALVTEARAQGAAACLELPLDLADLAYTLRRLTMLPAKPAQSAHDVPPPPALLRHHSGSRPFADSRPDHK